MSRIVSLADERRRRAGTPPLAIEVTHVHRREDGTLVVGHDPSRHLLTGGLVIVIAIIAGMWWSTGFRGVGPLLLLALLAILLAALAVPPSRLEIDREMGVLRARAYGWRGPRRLVVPIDAIADVGLVEWQHPEGGGTVAARTEVVIRLADGASIALQEPRSAKGHIDGERLVVIHDAIRRELSPDATGEEQQ